MSPLVFHLCSLAFCIPSFCSPPTIYFSILLRLSLYFHLSPSWFCVSPSLRPLFIPTSTFTCISILFASLLAHPSTPPTSIPPAFPPFFPPFLYLSPPFGSQNDSHGTDHSASGPLHIRTQNEDSGLAKNKLVLETRSLVLYSANQYSGI